VLVLGRQRDLAVLDDQRFAGFALRRGGIGAAAAVVEEGFQAVSSGVGNAMAHDLRREC
jgi:hypothetical protein